MKLLIHLISIIEKIVLLPLRLLALTNSAMRRLEYPPKKHRDLVIDIGGGGLPNPFAHVVVEGYPQDTERATKLRLDRNLVWAYADKLPFKDKVFSFSTMSHVLEHLYDPENSLKEIERISKAGYIETPNSFYETAVPHVYHVSRCDVIDNKLVVTPKKKWDEQIVENPLLEQIKIYFSLVNRYFPNTNLTRYVWQERIHYLITPGDFFEKNDALMEQHAGYNNRNFIKKLIIEFIYKILAPKKISLDSLLACPICKSDLEISGQLSCHCVSCKKSYHQLNGHFDFRV